MQFKRNGALHIKVLNTMMEIPPRKNNHNISYGSPDTLSQLISKMIHPWGTGTLDLIDHDHTSVITNSMSWYFGSI